MQFNHSLIGYNVPSQSTITAGLVIGISIQRVIVLNNFFDFFFRREKLPLSMQLKAFEGLFGSKTTNIDELYEAETMSHGVAPPR